MGDWMAGWLDVWMIGWLEIWKDDWIGGVIF